MHVCTCLYCTCLYCLCLILSNSVTPPSWHGTCFDHTHTHTQMHSISLSFHTFHFFQTTIYQLLSINMLLVVFIILFYIGTRNESRNFGLTLKQTLPLRRKKREVPCQRIKTLTKTKISPNLCCMGLILFVTKLIAPSAEVPW